MARAWNCTVCLDCLSRCRPHYDRAQNATRLARAGGRPGATWPAVAMTWPPARTGSRHVPSPSTRRARPGRVGPRGHRGVLAPPGTMRSAGSWLRIFFRAVKANALSRQAPRVTVLGRSRPGPDHGHGIFHHGPPARRGPPREVTPYALRIGVNTTVSSIAVGVAIWIDVQSWPRPRAPRRPLAGLGCRDGALWPRPARRR